MGRLLVLILVAAGVAPAAAEGPASDRGFDGRLVMGVIGRDASGTVVREHAVVADPRTGEVRVRRLPGGTLCYSRVAAVGDRVVFAGQRGRRTVALSLPLTLNGRPRILAGRAPGQPERDAAVSPDGDRAALPVTDHGISRLAVVDRASGRRTMVPGGRLRGYYRSIAWSPLGAWVYFTGGGDRVLAWAPGMAHAIRVPIDPGGEVMTIETAG
jgi:hypothetical protein